jgi:hypothetical protein
MGELQDCLGHLVFELPEGRMQAHQLTNHRLELGDLVLGQLLGKTLGEMVGCQGVGQQVLVEKHPALVLLPECLVKQRHERLAGGGRARASLGSERDEGTNLGRLPDRSGLRILQPGLQNGQSCFDVAALSHEMWPSWLLLAAIPPGEI